MATSDDFAVVRSIIEDKLHQEFYNVPTKDLPPRMQPRQLPNLQDAMKIDWDDWKSWEWMQPGWKGADACGAPTAGGMRARHWWLFVVSLAICFQGVKADKENIVKLTKFNFDDNVKRGAWFVKFYAPWCTHCQRLAPIWEKLADQAVSQDWPVKIADVDCTVSKTICEKANIKAFPTLALISEGKLKGKYSGEATASAFQTWLAEQGVLQDGSPAPAQATSRKQEAPDRPEQKLTSEETRPSATATHSTAIKAVAHNLLSRFPTESIITNIYVYFFIVMTFIVTFYITAFQMLEEEHAKES